MKRILLALGLFLVTAGPVAAEADTLRVGPARSAPVVSVQVSAGVSGFDLEQAALVHQAVVESYVRAGVALPTQRLFPSAPILSLELMVEPGAPSGARWSGVYGVGARFGEASAYSLYGDHSGTLDVVSRVRVVTLESVSRAQWRTGGRLEPFAGSRGGLVWGRSEVSESLEMPGVGSASAAVEGSGVGYTVEGYVGSALRVSGGVSAYAQVGYRHARVPKLEGAAYHDGRAGQTGELGYRLDLSGVVGMGGVAVRLW